MLNFPQSSFYSALIKVRADSQKIDERMRTVVLVGIEEKSNENDTRRFDEEIVGELVNTSGNSDLVREFESGHIAVRRHPPNRPQNSGRKGRIIKITLTNQELRDSLLFHMRCGRQSLTREFIYSFARRDYTPEELALDRSLRKQAGELNAKEGMLT